MDFLVAGLAAVSAGFFTNPLEVVKIRMQLQGELSSKGQYVVKYKHILHASYIIAKHDGILALQAGLVPAQWYQFFLNGIRLGSFQFLNNKGYTKDTNGNIVFYRTVLLSGVCGIFGGVVGSPLFLVKTHLQAQSSKEIAFGHQHNHEGTWKALNKIFKDQGVKGLFRGNISTIPRVFIGSTSQLTSFEYCKKWINSYPSISSSPLLVTIISSFIGGIMITVCMTPFDLISTRLYNQGVGKNGKGLLYSSYFDCIQKIWKSEGFFGFYKGFGPSYIRLGPHTVLCLVFWDRLKEFFY